MKLLLVCLGGAVGSGARYVVGGWVQNAAGTLLPWGTLAVNLAGSCLLGVLVQLGTTTDLLSPNARLLLGMGVLGGFTTYSSFNQETLRYLQEGAWALAIGYTTMTVLGCLAAGAAGMALARWCVG